jgi:hypothetical protein
MSGFNVGDKVRFIKDGMIDWENEQWWEYDELEIGQEYTIRIIDGGILLHDHIYAHHPDHFELVEKGDNYIVKFTQDEVNALLSISNYINGDYDTSSIVFRLLYSIIEKDSDMLDSFNNRKIPLPSVSFGFNTRVK